MGQQSIIRALISKDDQKPLFADCDPDVSTNHELQIQVSQQTVVGENQEVEGRMLEIRNGM